jgi:hypothetical protein
MTAIVDEGQRNKRSWMMGGAPPLRFLIEALAHGDGSSSGEKANS